MNKLNMLKLLVLFLFVTLFLYSYLFAQSSENFKLSTRVMDSFGKRAESENFLLRISSGGQPGVVGFSQTDSLHGLQGYVHTAAFQHGDDDADGDLDVSDVIYEINFLFKGGPRPKPPEVGDVNCDNDHSVSDVIYKINFLFKGGPKPSNL